MQFGGRSYGFYKQKTIDNYNQGGYGGHGYNRRYDSPQVVVVAPQQQQYQQPHYQQRPIIPVAIPQQPHPVYTEGVQRTYYQY